MAVDVKQRDACREFCLQAVWGNCMGIQRKAPVQFAGGENRSRKKYQSTKVDLQLPFRLSVLLKHLVAAYLRKCRESSQEGTVDKVLKKYVEAMRPQFDSDQQMWEFIGDQCFVLIAGMARVSPTWRVSPIKLTQSGQSAAEKRDAILDLVKNIYIQLAEHVWDEQKSV